MPITELAPEARYTWYADFLSRAGLTPRPFDEWQALGPERYGADTYQETLYQIGKRIRAKQPVADEELASLQPDDAASMRRLQGEYRPPPPRVREPVTVQRGRSGVELVTGGEITSSDKPDDYHYHVTTAENAQHLLDHGFSPRPRAGHSMDQGFYRDYSKNKTFFTDLPGVNYWKERIGAHLESQHDHPPPVAVVRVPKGSLQGIQPDELGTRDANAPSWFAPHPVTFTPPSEPARYLAGNNRGWLGVDLDGVLARYDDRQGAFHIGEPVPEMVQRVRQWLADGRDVRIFTARVYGPDAEKHRRAIEQWCRQYIGRVLPITNQKDPSMYEFWDDRAIQVARNTGKPIGRFAQEGTPERYGEPASLSTGTITEGIHRTTPEAADKIRREGFDLSHFGKGAGARSGEPHGIYFSLPGQESDFASEVSDRKLKMTETIPLRVHPNAKVLNWDDREQRYADQREAGRRYIKRTYGIENDADADMVWRGMSKKARAERPDLAEASLAHLMKTTDPEADAEQSKELAALLRERGVDVVTWKDAFRGVRQAVAINPSVLRINRDIEQYSMTAAEIDAAVKEWSPPTEAQQEAGNYAKPTISWKGLTIKIETPKGQRRKPEFPEMPCHYGYVARLGNQAAPEARDDDKVDCFVGPELSSDLVVVIDQETQSGRFDEWKVVIGCTNQAEALELYRGAYSPGWRVGPATSMTVEQFKAWLADMPTKGRIAPQVSRYTAEGTPEMQSVASLPRTGSPARILGYHATTRQFDRFDVNAPPRTKVSDLTGRGVYFYGDRDNAERLWTGDKPKRIIQASSQLDNPFVFRRFQELYDYTGVSHQDPDKASKVTKALMQKGHDGHVKLYQSKDGIDEFVVFDPAKIHTPPTDTKPEKPIPDRYAARHKPQAGQRTLHFESAAPTGARKWTAEQEAQHPRDDTGEFVEKDTPAAEPKPKRPAAHEDQLAEHVANLHDAMQEQLGRGRQFLARHDGKPLWIPSADHLRISPDRQTIEHTDPQGRWVRADLAQLDHWTERANLQPFTGPEGILTTKENPDAGPTPTSGRDRTSDRATPAPTDQTGDDRAVAGDGAGGPGNGKEVGPGREAERLTGGEYDDELRESLGVTRQTLDHYSPEQAVKKFGRRWTYTTIEGNDHPSGYDTKREALEAARRHLDLKEDQFRNPSDYREITSVRAERRIKIASDLMKKGMSELDAYREARKQVTDPAPTEKLTGGRADQRPDSDFDPEALAQGTRVEQEHTSDPAQAREIAKDHLTEDPKYYTKLAKMEESDAPDHPAATSDLPRTDRSGEARPTAGRATAGESGVPAGEPDQVEGSGPAGADGGAQAPDGEPGETAESAGDEEQPEGLAGINRPHRPPDPEVPEADDSEPPEDLKAEWRERLKGLPTFTVRQLKDDEMRRVPELKRKHKTAPSRYAASQAADELLQYRAYLAVQRERIAGPAVKGDLREFAKTLYSAYRDQLDRYSAESPVDQSSGVATLEQGGPKMPRKPKLQPFMVYNADRTSGVSVRARDEQHAVQRATRWIDPTNAQARPIASGTVPPHHLTSDEFDQAFRVHFDRPGPSSDIYPASPEARRASMMQGIQHGMAGRDIDLRDPSPRFPETAPRAAARGWAAWYPADKPGAHAYAVPESSVDSNARIRPGTKPVASAVLSRVGESVHEALVREALEQGQYIPPRVLAQYPHLIKPQ